MKIINIHPGPIYDLERTYKAKYEALSKFSSGFLISTGPYALNCRLGNYDAVLLKANEKSTILEFWRTLSKAVAISKKEMKFNDDVIVVCYDPIKTGLIGVILKQIFGFKLLIEVNGVYDSEFNKNTTFKDWLYPKLQSYNLKRADGIKCLFKNQLTNFKINHSTVISCFSNYSDVKPSPYTEPDKKTILSLGFPAYRKGFDVLIKAFMQLNDINTDWTLRIMGHLNEQEIKMLKRLANGAHNVVIDKPVSFKNIPNVILSSSIFVLASRSEAMSRALLEAMALGRPRIGSNVDGIPTIINDGKDGILFESQNVQDLAEKLRLLMNDNEFREKLGNQGYNRFKNEFNIESYANNMKVLCEAL